MFSKLQYISQGDTQQTQVLHIRQALDHGCDWIQLRFKKATPKELLEVAEMVKRLCESYQATFIMNDHVDWAQYIDADGIHLGLTDTCIPEARRILGPNKIIGGTANTLTDVLQRVEEKCDYIGLGPFRFTTTKEKLSPILGLEGYRDITRELSLRNIQIPLYAIGGIQLEDILPLQHTNIYGVAVSGMITQTPQLITTLKHQLYVIT